MLNPNQAKEIISLIKSAEIEMAFIKLKEYNIETLEVTRFQKEYIFGKYGFDFYERFPAYINTIAHTNHNVVPPNFDIFFSFSSNNKSAAQREVKKLRDAGLKVFFSGEDLNQHIGQEFFDKIQHALNYTKHFVLYCTPQAMESKWVNIECSTFFQQIHIQDERRRLFIVRGKNFKNDLVPLLMRGIQSSTTEEVITVLKPVRNPVKPKPISKKENDIIFDSNFIVRFVNSKSDKYLVRMGISLFILAAGMITLLEVGKYKLGNERNDTTNQAVIIDTTSYSKIDSIKIRLPKDLKLIKVEGGNFMMGGNDGRDNEKPVHKVTLTDYYIAETEVTNTQYAEFLNEYGSDEVKTGDYKGQKMIEEYKWGLKKENGTWKPQTGYENHPVIYVNWLGANEFCNYYKGFLPSEAQWEYAARGGNKSNSYKYAGSNDLNEVAWNATNSGSKTHQVKTKQPNELGLYDMSGNVWEWCQDWYGAKFYENNKNITNPINNSGADGRVLRGGSSWYDTVNCRSANRVSDLPTRKFYDFGFRICLSSI